MLLDIRRAGPADLDRVHAFYRGWNYRRPIGPRAVILIAELDRELAGLVRLEPEHGTTVLRGMRVQPEHQRRGIGAALLEAVRQQLGDGACYCLAYAHLTGFYGRIGFITVPADAAPAFLRERVAQYSRERDDFVLLWRAGGG
jgi:GNAT superfamily N-acetyltransferase